MQSAHIRSRQPSRATSRRETQACNRESKYEKNGLHTLLHENDYISTTYRRTRSAIVV